MFTEYGSIQKQALVYTMDLQEGSTNFNEIWIFRNNNSEILEADILLDLDAALFFADEVTFCEN